MPDSESVLRNCENCEGEGQRVPVWESREAYENNEDPDYIGCTSCSVMEDYDA